MHLKSVEPVLKKEFFLPLRVYIEDTDAGGIVFYSNYLKYMERARTELFRGLGFPKPATIADGLLLVVASANVKYLTPAKLDDELKVTAEVEKIARTYLIVKQKVFRDNTCLCDAEIKVACVDREKLKPRALPDGVKSAFKHYMGSAV